MSKNFNGRIAQKHDIAVNWQSAINFSPLAGEIIVYDVDNIHSAPRIKIGDGTTNVNALPFVDNNVCIVKVTDNGIDKTYNELLVALGEGKLVLASMQTQEMTGLFLTSVGADENGIRFLYTLQDYDGRVGTFSLTIDPNGTPNFETAVTSLTAPMPEENDVGKVFMVGTDGSASWQTLPNSLTLDNTLSISGAAADAKKVGDELAKKQNNLVFNTAYNASTNKVATMKDLPSINGLATQTYVDTAISEISFPVESVNGKVGTVQLTASDVGALPNTTTIPQKIFSKVNAGGTVIEADTQTDTLFINAGTNISISANASSDTVTINSTYSLPEAGTDLGGVKSGGDVTISNGVITVNDDSHDHTIANIDNLQDTLDDKAEKADAITGLSVSGKVITYTKGDGSTGTITTQDTNTTSFTITATAEDDDVVVLEGTNGSNKVTYKATHAKKGPSSQYTSNNTTTSISGSGGSGTIKVPQVTVDTYGHVTAAADEEVTITLPTIPTTLKNPKSLTVGSKTYDGSAAISITAADLGLSAAMKFLGTSATAISDGSTTNPITIGTTSTTVAAGNVVLYGAKEYVWTGSVWEELGNEGSYKIVQEAVSSPSASGNATAFIDTISQDTNGKITVTKKNVSFPSLSGGSAAAADATVVGGVTVNGHAVTVGKKTLMAGSNVTITGASDKITISATDTTYGIVSTSANGLAPKLPNDTTKWLRGDGTWQQINQVYWIDY